MSARFYGFWPVVPVAAPRQVQSDRWKPKRLRRPAVGRYRAFRDECRLRRVWAPTDGDLVVFLLPIPRTRRQEGLAGTPHRQVPDVDNLLKALLDASYARDEHVAQLSVAKYWSDTPGIYIERREPLDLVDLAGNASSTLAARSGVGQSSPARQRRTVRSSTPSSRAIPRSE